MVERKWISNNFFLSDVFYDSFAIITFYLKHIIKLTILLDTTQLMIQVQTSLKIGLSS
jgi:hypothetical protein